jgi:hypothetical protein
MGIHAPLAHYGIERPIKEPGRNSQRTKFGHRQHRHYEFGQSCNPSEQLRARTASALAELAEKPQGFWGEVLNMAMQ